MDSPILMRMEMPETLPLYYADWERPTGQECNMVFRRLLRGVLAVVFVLCVVAWPVSYWGGATLCYLPKVFRRYEYCLSFCQGRWCYLRDYGTGGFQVRFAPLTGGEFNGAAKWHFWGFAYNPGQPDGYLHFIRVPHWFLVAVSGVFTALFWRIPNAISPCHAFPVEVRGPPDSHNVGP
jgi:hypothetical protein